MTMKVIRDLSAEESPLPLIASTLSSDAVRPAPTHCTGIFRQSGTFGVPVEGTSLVFKGAHMNHRMLVFSLRRERMDGMIDVCAKAATGRSAASDNNKNDNVKSI